MSVAQLRGEARDRSLRDGQLGIPLVQLGLRACRGPDQAGGALDLYFRSCAISLDCRALSVVAATLANGGVCPLTGHRIAEPAVIRNTLSLMLTCGMYDFSGEFAFVVGLPAKSGVSGGLMLIVPGVCGIGLWSPPLDPLGNTVRGLEFARRLVEAFPFHIFAGTTGGQT